jgi:hypothetical protein
MASKSVTLLKPTVSIPVLNLRVGHVIVDGRHRTPIRTLEFCPSSMGRKLHVNGSDCYDGISRVNIEE